MSATYMPISVAIPTFRREHVLLQTIDALLGQYPGAAEILIIDQTLHHEPATEERLQQWNSGGQIRWIRLDKPSIPVAMNRALICAKHEVVLFLDDDIIPGNDLLFSHLSNYEDGRIWGVAGQVLQPGQIPVDVQTGTDLAGPVIDAHFPFNSRQRVFVSDCMAGNLSVRRNNAIRIGGFDENFIGVAYKFESDFARRLLLAGGKIVFEPRASIRHLREPSGGTRKYGNHLTSPSPKHGVGAYYYALKQGWSFNNFLYIVRRPFLEVITRFHLLHPWWIPVKLAGEILAMLLALFVWLRGPRYIESSGPGQE